MNQTFKIRNSGENLYIVCGSLVKTLVEWIIKKSQVTHQFRATLCQIYPPDWFFLGLIIRIGPIREAGPLQEHPPTLPSARAGDVVEHGEETSVSHLYLPQLQNVLV